MSDLNGSRKEIEAIDRQMAELFVRRMHCSKEIAAYKKENGMPILDEGREKALIEKNQAYVEEDLLKPYYKDFLKGILGVSKQYQHTLMENMRVAYTGIEGAFANIAAGKIFPDGELHSFKSFKKAYNSVVNGECDVVVLPIENSYAGEVSQVMDLMYEGELHINGIYPLRISQNLLGVEGASLKTIKQVVSHPQALDQCGDYINEHGFESIQASNTAVAARQVAEANDPTIAAIASRETAALYGLEVIDHDINEDTNNTTRFAVLSRNWEEVINADEGATVILMFTVKNEAGMLAEAIGVIGKYGFSMNALRSNPLKKLSWQYYFYVEIAGAHSSAKIKEMLDEMSGFCGSLKVLGASRDYPTL